MAAGERRVIAAIARHKPTSRNLNHTLEASAGVGERLADQVAQFGGSWAFISLFILGLTGWIIANLILSLHFGSSFDPYPFIFLNLVLSMVAALQAPIILMSQNRQADRDRAAAGLDYEINLKSELEIMALHDKLDALRVDHIVQLLTDQQDQLCQIIAIIGNYRTSRDAE
ncbi:MAG: DUF1003 domain-containing protein [Sphingomicrobium sp.]